MREIVNKVKFSAVKSLTRLVISALENATLQIEEQDMRFGDAQLPPLRSESDTVAERFMLNLNQHFDTLVGKVAVAETEPDYEGLDTVDHDYLEAIIAMEGMVNHARNTDISEYLSFSTRLDSVFENLKIDETNNPLDPEQIGDAFNSAIQPLGLKAHYLLTIYREFNKAVFHNLEGVLAEANQTLIDMGVMPDLDIKARDREQVRTKRAANRPKTDAKSRAFEEEEARPVMSAEEVAQQNAEMFAMLRKLLQGLIANPDQQPPVAAAPGDDSAEVSEQQLATLRQALLNRLSEVQTQLASAAIAHGDPSQRTLDSDAITGLIDEALEAGKQSGELGNIDGESSDVINLLALLYKAIWDDDSLPLVMKELIGRTQIPITKLALMDTSFFGDQQHPGRVLLNEFAMAGIAWTEPDMVVQDPTYGKVRELVQRVLAMSQLDNAALQAIINELRIFKGQQSGQDHELEQRLRESDEHTQRLDDVDDFVRQKIDERIIKSGLDPSIRNLLDTYLHQFLVKLVLQEGPGGSSWKPVMSTIDVLLWTVQAEKHPGDRERFDKINPRLLDNLTKALEIGGASKSRITKIMRQLKQVQEYSFHHIVADGGTPQAANPAPADKAAAPPAQVSKREPPPLSRDDPHLRQVDHLPIGIWLEFKGVQGTPVRCTLAAKIDSIDKLFFVNRQGVKVVELTRMRLAHELKAGSVKIVSEGSLVDRAMESVISSLRGFAPEPSNSAAT